MAPGESRIFIQAPQYHWHTVASAGTDAEARERLVALERQVFAFGRQTEEREAELLARIAQLEAQRGSAMRITVLFGSSLAWMASSWRRLSRHWRAEWIRRLEDSPYPTTCMN